MLFIILLHLVSFFQDDIPYKPDDEFAIKFEFGFRKRSDPNSEDLVLSQVASSSYDRNDSSPLPHLKTILEVVKKDSLEVKLRIVRDNTVNVAKRKIEPGIKVTVFSAFVDDIKDQIQGYQHAVYFLDKDNNRLTKIVIEFDEEGFYSVNGKKKGKI
jgi:hypothetical protein